MPKITKIPKNHTEIIKVKTKAASSTTPTPSAWWKEATIEKRAAGACATAAFLKENQQYRYRQAALFSRLYGNMPMFGWVGSNLTKLTSGSQLPIDRPTFNVVQSCIDTLTSRIVQGKPLPSFLTDLSDYKQRLLAKKMNNFIQGELYQTKAYQKAEFVLRDAEVLGTGAFKIFKDMNKRVAIERTLITDLLVDPNDALYGYPRQLYQLSLIDRAVLDEMFPKQASIVKVAEQAYADKSTEYQKTVSDQIMVVESWHLPSGPDADDGKHLISCTAGPLLDEDYEKDHFPFVFLHYTPRILGFWAQSLAEQLMGTQLEINKLLMTVSSSINLVGVPRVFVEEGSKVVKAHLNNQIGSIITYRGTMPSYQVAPCVPEEIYAQLQRLIDYAYQIAGISALAAASKKPLGLDSGKALREYDDLQTDRFAAFEKRWEGMFVEMTYQIIENAMEIAEEEGEYDTVYPSKNLSQQIDLPDAKLLKNPYIIKCLDASSLSKDPAGRKQDVIDMIQAGMLTPQEGRRLLYFSDLEQVEVLENAAEEKILKLLDKIVEEGDEEDFEYEGPDPDMNIELAEKLVNQYINLYTGLGIEEEKANLLRNFSSQVKNMKNEAAQAMQPPAAANPQQPLGVPEPRPVSDILPMQQPQTA